MTKRNESTSADETSTGPSQDLEAQRRRADREARRERREQLYADLERPFLDVLSKQGYAANSTEELVKKYAPLPPAVVDVLLTNLESFDVDETLEAVVRQNVIESLVRALAAASEPFDGAALAKSYERKGNEALQWVILNTIACAKPHSIDGWIRKVEKFPGVRKTLHDLGYYR